MTTPTQPPKGVAKQPETQSVPGPEQIRTLKSDCANSLPFLDRMATLGETQVFTKKRRMMAYDDVVAYINALETSITAKDARIKELEEALRDIFAVDDTAKNGTEYENEMSIALQKAKTLAAKE